MGQGPSKIKRNFTAWRLSRKKGNQKLKTKTSCPVCNQEFEGWRTYDDFNYHIDWCLNQSTTQSPPPELKSAQSLKFKPLDKKLKWLRKQIDTIRIPWSEEFIKLGIQRDNIFDDSLRQILSLSDRDMRKEFQISFQGEIAQDAGGLMREWVNLLIKVLFAPDLGLFEFTKTEEVAYTISIKAEEHMEELYYFTGKLLGKALFENIPVNCPLSKVIFKHLVGKKVIYSDLIFQDQALHNSLNFITSNSVKGVLFETFSVIKEYQGQVSVIPLIPGGEDHAVSDGNKEEYIRLRSQFEIETGFKVALENLKLGFYSVIPKEIISELEPDEIELALCGSPFIDIEDWKEFTEYRGVFHKDHRVIQRFWEIMRTFSQEQLSNFLTFVTGTSRVPIEGFSSLKTLRGEKARFTLDSMPYTEKALPRAHTCFNRLDLPLYKSKNELKEALECVLNNYTIGFGLE